MSLAGVGECRRCQRRLMESDKFCGACGAPTSLASIDDMLDMARRTFHRIRKTPGALERWYEIEGRGSPAGERRLRLR